MILIDVAEPTDLIKLLAQVTDTEIMALNQQSMGDYYFGGDDGRTRQFCRVQAGELLSSIDSQEDELRRYYENADDTYLIVEGLITDIPITKKDKSKAAISARFRSRPQQLFSYHIAPNGFIYGEHAHLVSSEKLYAWYYRLSECGVGILYTHNYVGTAKCLSSIWHNAQKDPSEHNTLNRYYIPKISLGEFDDKGKKITIRKQNPFIRGLMALSVIYGLDIGEKRATAIYEFGYESLVDLSWSTVEELAEVEGIGKGTAKKLLNALGVNA